MTLKQSRNWAFTDFELLDLKTVFDTQKDIIRYICAGEEKCPETDKVHVQGWIQFTTKRRRGGVKKILGSKAIHVEPCFSCEFDNENYCKKDNNYITFGKFITQGQRTDLEGMVKMIEDEKPMIEVARSNPATWIQYNNGLSKYSALVKKEKSKDFRKVEVIYIHGTTGTGKTREAMKEATFKIEGCALDWWDGYDGEKTILIDEYANDIKITKLLNILDGYQLRLPIKGGFTYARWTKVFITSNLDEYELHGNAKASHRDALRRRITTIKELKIPLSTLAKKT